MARRIEIYLCTACDGVAPQWVGRCPHCGQWNTLTTAAPRTTGARAFGPGNSVLMWGFFMGGTVRFAYQS